MSTIISKDLAFLVGYTTGHDIFRLVLRTNGDHDLFHCLNYIYRAQSAEKAKLLTHRNLSTLKYGQSSQKNGCVEIGHVDTREPKFILFLYSNPIFG